MSDNPSRLELLHFARRVVERQARVSLGQLDRWIAEEERREAERRRGVENRPPAPEWLLQYGLNKKNVDAVHAGGCWAAAKSRQCQPVSREQAVEALLHHVPACVHCRPDTVLRLLE
ncbi:DUF6233 domain-containing protein [Streptomyces sp. 049-1]|uniref:DUF6233 domain-containing protein n=1 Tax=Streptomyces sp. 049-1 TaxID=2789264 RepID=UPI003981336F